MRTNSRAADGNTLTLHLFKLKNMNIFLALFGVYLCIDGEWGIFFKLYSKIKPDLLVSSPVTFNFNLTALVKKKKKKKKKCVRTSSVHSRLCQWSYSASGCNSMVALWPYDKKLLLTLFLHSYINLTLHFFIHTMIVVIIMTNSYRF